MQKIKTFFNTFYKSLVSPKYYRDVLQAKSSFSLKYFLILILLSSIINTGLQSAKNLPQAKNAINAFNKQILTSYPSDLIITAKDGRLSSNKAGPIIIPISSEMPSDSRSRELKNVLVFDPNGTVDDLKKYETVILINKSNVIMQGENDQIKIQPLKDIPDGTFTYADFTIALGKLEKILAYVPYLLSTAMLVISFTTSTVSGLIISLLLSLIFWIFAKITHLNLRLAKTYQISLHIFTLYAILGIANQVFTKGLPYGFNFIVCTIYGLFIISKIQKTSPTPLIQNGT